MQEKINLLKLKEAWLSKLDLFQQKYFHYQEDIECNTDEIDLKYIIYHLILDNLSVDDLINPPKEEKIEREIEKVIVNCIVYHLCDYLLQSECKQDDKANWTEDTKNSYLQSMESSMSYVNNVKENLETVRQEPLTLATLLADKDIIKADDIDKQIENLSLHSFKYILISQKGILFVEILRKRR